MSVFKKVICGILSFSVLIGVFSACPASAESKDENRSRAASGNSPYTATALNGWNDETMLNDSIAPSIQSMSVDSKPVTGSQINLSAGSVLSFEFSVEKSDEYTIAVKYYPVDALYMDCLLDFKADSDSYVVALPLVWADANSVYATDRLGNELVPEQTAVAEYYIDYIKDYQDTDMDVFTLKLEKGSHRIELSPQSQELVIGEIYITPIKNNISYEEYLAKNSSSKEIKETKILEAEDYMIKSDSFIRAANKKNSALYPYDTYRKLLNVIDEGSWNSSGQKILWEFEVDEDGYYAIAIRYLQNSDSNKPVYRRVEIDGFVPFSEWEELAFANTKTGKYANKVFDVNGSAAKVYLTKGKHTLSLTATMGPLEEVYDEIVALMEDINSLGMDIQKITAGQTDLNRTWNMEYYLPNAVTDLESFAERIDKIYEELEEIGGCKPSYADSLKYASETLRKLIKTPNQIPNKTDLINQGDNSATKYLGNVLETLNSMPMSIDRFYFGNTDKLPKAESSLGGKIAEWIKAFFYSFTKDASVGDYSASGTGESEELTVWVNRSVQYVQILQQLVDADYNSKYGTNIQLSIMPSEQKLILSNAAGTNPDVVLGAGLTTPFNLAIRGAAKNLLEYDDFLTFYNENYNLQSLVPMTFGDGVYGTAETQDFYVLFYRKDILDTLGLSVPDTWDDVKSMMPTLLRYGMNFFIPLSSGSAYKGFAFTSPIVYQNNATYVSEDGTISAFDTESFIDAMTEMTELYSIYGMASSVPSFYNSFRNGEIPIGISTFSNYIQLQMAAPELAGKWGIALAPGTVQEDGSILRYQPAASNACMILENTKKSDEAWQFLKWWLSTDVQTKYAYSLQSTYGSEYRWNSANLKAFAQMPYTADDKAVILAQWQAQMETVNHPANYMIERQTSEIWNGVVVDNESLIEEIDKAAASTDRELIRKLKEFGFCDSDGNMVKEYSMNAYNTLKNKLEQAQKGEK